MILATEMTRHFEHLAKFVSIFGTDVEVNFDFLIQKINRFQKKYNRIITYYSIIYTFIYIYSYYKVIQMIIKY